MAREKGSYVNEHGISLFDLVLDLYDRWLMGLPYLRRGSGGAVAGDSQPELVREVWRTVQQLCIRLEVDGKGDLAARVERAFRDAEDYARIIDNYCESDQFDYHLWAYGDPALDTIRTVDAEPAALLAQAEEIGEREPTEDLYFTAFEHEWAAELGKRSTEIEIEKYGHPATDDYAERTEMEAWACFWLAAQLHRRGLSHQEASGYLEQYLSNHMVVSETKYPVIHEALGRAYGMDIYPVAPLESEEVDQGLEGLSAVVLEIRDALALVEEPESPSWTPEVPSVELEEPEVPDTLRPCPSEHCSFTLEPGGHWLIYYEGRKVGLFDNDLGFRYIHALLRRQGENVSAITLRDDCRRMPGDKPTSPDFAAAEEELGRQMGGGEMTDKKTVAQVLEQQRELKAEREACTNPERAAEISEQLAAIRQYLKQVTDGHGRIRPMPGGPRKRAADAVRSAIQKAIRKIKEENQEENRACGLHLQGNISCGANPKYAPNPAVDWQLS
jgi:hypothetical protein